MTNPNSTQYGKKLSRQAEAVAQVQGCDRFEALDIIARSRGFSDFGNMIQQSEHSPRRPARIPSQDDLKAIYSWFVSSHSHGDDVYMSEAGVYLDSVFEEPEEIQEYLADHFGWPSDLLRAVAERIYDEGPWQREHDYLNKWQSPLRHKTARY